MKSVPDFQARLGLTLSASLLAMAACAANADDSLLTYTFGNGATVTTYGQINEAWLNYDDGQEQRDFAPVANNNSSNRAGILYENPRSNGTSLNFRAEMQYMPRPSNKVNFADPYVNDYALKPTDIRKFEVWYESETVGNFWLGQGSMASDNIAEIDLSGTTVTAYSAATDTAGGFYFRQKNGTLSNIQVSNTYSNLDGFRRMRFRYDTPSFAGFTASAAYGQEVEKANDNNDYYDAAIRYDLKTDAVKLQAGIGYNWILAPSGGTDREFYSGSISALHVPSGLNATIAGGSNVNADGDFWYAKLGIIRNFIAIGSTALSVDYGYGNKFAGADGQFTTWSLEAVQKWDRTNLEIFALYRLQAFDDDTSRYDDGTAWFAGARWKF
ncbi:MAG: porin [Rhodobacteraceae bacterium]|nr:porin [Paracoccaceae bacterium]